jgi:murein DD-endopeptidase MepM/ murein hydrolase activator NlpD
LQTKCAIMKKKTIIISVCALLLLIAVGVVSYLLLREKKANQSLNQEFQLEKTDLEDEYSRFSKQYDEIKMTVKNDSLASLLDKEQTKTQRLLEELRAVKSTNATEIRRLRRELDTMRKVMVSYINEIDSLNQLTAKQRAQINDISQKYDVASKQINSLSEEKKTLAQKVTLAAQLDASNVWIEAKNKRGKNAKKIKDAVKLAVGFTIVKNITAETGVRSIFVRITKPDNEVLTNSGATFNYENRQLTYSIKKDVEYRGEELPVTVYWDVNEFLYAGTYRVDIFAGGSLIGSSSVTLK